MSTDGVFSVDHDMMIEAIKKHSLSDGYKSAVSTVPEFVNYETLIEDYERTLDMFYKELERDFSGAKSSFDITKAPYNEWSEYFNDEVFCFMFLEGYVEVEYAKDANGKEDKNKFESLNLQYTPSVVKDKQSAICPRMHSMRFSSIP